MSNNFIEKINIFFPKWNYEIIEYSGTREELVIKCLKCGKIYHYKNARDIFRKTNPCNCYKIFSSVSDKIIYFSKIYDFTILKIDTIKATVKCNKCGEEKEKSLVSLKQYPNACSCKSYPKKNKQLLQKELDNLFPNEYLILESDGEVGKALIKHLNCGFIFTVKCFYDLINKRNRGCPKCYQFKSLGEKTIMKFLEDNKINYIPQKTFAPLNKSKYRFDFFIPEINLAIEYQGEQHFRDNGFFRDELNVIQKRDLIKREYCKNNNIELLEISYKDYKNIAQILSSKFNDYGLTSREKSLEKDSNEDIV